MLLTLSSDPRMWMGGWIPTRWRRYNRQNRQNRDDQLTFQIGCCILCFLVNKSTCLVTFSKKHKQGIGFKATLRPPFYTLTNEGKVY